MPVFNNASFKSQSVFNDNTVVIEMLSTRPSLVAPIEGGARPNRLVGYYNGAQGVVELFVVDSSGTQWKKVR